MKINSIALGLLFTAFQLLSFPLFADRPLSPQQRLSKLSSVLRFGLQPDGRDRERLQRMDEANREAFFAQITQEYMNSHKFTETMVYHLEELFRLRSTPSMSYSTSDYGSYPSRHGALNQLFVEIIKQNLNWDYLLTAKSYTVYQRITSDGPSEFGFYRQLDPYLAEIIHESRGLPPVDDSNVIRTERRRFSAPEDDLRVAGAITTPRFISRYSNTNSLKGRRRAAAIYRIFLCDNMVAALPPSTIASREQMIRSRFPNPNQQTQPNLGDGPRPFVSPMHGDEEQHGRRADCAACHYKLDPVGESLALIGTSLSNRPVTSRFAYRKATGEIFNVATQGVGDLAKIITEQEDYVSCQVDHFLNWFIGKDVPISAARKAELVAEFERVGRRPKDFIAVLLSTPEFLTHYESTQVQIVISSVQQTLSRCTSCHLSIASRPEHGYGMLPTISLTEFPMGGTKEHHEDLAALIKGALAVDRNFTNADMPPRDSGWQLTEAEKANFREWFKLGAPYSSEVTPP